MKSVLVTGGTVRLGRVIAEYLRDHGYRVVTTSSRGDSGADVVADFRDPMGPAKCYASALAMLSGNPPDALVNNAALFTGSDMDLEAVNYVAPKKLTMLMAGRETPGRGSIVNILDATGATGDRPHRNAKYSGAAGDRPHRNAKYSETKRELRKYTHYSAGLFADTLRVNSVSPGPVAELAPVGVHEPAEACPLGRPKAIDIAKAVAFLLDNESVTGVDLAVDGGLGVVGL